MYVGVIFDQRRWRSKNTATRYQGVRMAYSLKPRENTRDTYGVSYLQAFSFYAEYHVVCSGSVFTAYVVVVVDSHIQRIVLATEETTVTQQVSHRPIKCQSRLWSQRGTKVNGSHHGDNPLLRPTGIQIATKSYAALQAMAPTNIKTVHQTSLLHIESNLDRLGMLSPTHDQRSQQKTGKITLQPVLINKSKFLKATHFVQK